MRRSLLLLLALGACGGGVEPGGEEIAVRLVTPASTVEVGRPFGLTVLRRWSKALTPSAFDERLLSPLVLRAAGVARREGETHIEEERTYDAFLFRLEPVRIGPIPFRARPDRMAESGALDLEVRPALDPKAPGPAELPGPAPAPALPWFSTLLVGLALLGALLLRRRPREPKAPPPPPDPLRLPEGDLLVVGEFIRKLAGDRHAIPAEARTTEELVAALPAQRATLEAILRPGDRVKFARHIASDAESAEVRRRAEEFLREP